MGSNLPAYIPNYLTLAGCFSSFSSLSQANSSYLSQLLVFDLVFLPRISISSRAICSSHSGFLCHKFQCSRYSKNPFPPAIIHPSCFPPLTAFLFLFIPFLSPPGAQRAPGAGASFNPSHLYSVLSFLFSISLPSPPPSSPVSILVSSSPLSLTLSVFFFVHFNWKSGHTDRHTLLAKPPLTSSSACASPH